MKVDAYKPRPCRGLTLQLNFNEGNDTATVIITAQEYIKGIRHSKPLVVEYRMPYARPTTLDGVYEVLAEAVLSRTLPHTST